MPIIGNTGIATFVANDGVTQTLDVTGQIVNAVGDALVNGYAGPFVFSTDPNVLASNWRSNGIPAGATPTFETVSVAAQYSVPPNEKDWRVRISCELFTSGSGGAGAGGTNNVLAPLSATNGLIFPYLPQITMSHSANYAQMDIAHINHPFFAYKNSQVDEIAITGKFTVQTQTEAQYWLAAVHFLKTITKSFFGTGENLGNPPPICKLNGYGDFVYNEVPVIVKNFTVTMPNDVDYIASSVGGGQGTAGANVTYVPVSSDISVSVQPVYSRTESKTFDLNKFASGEMLKTQSGSGWI
jgi:hypothetical protein